MKSGAASTGNKGFRLFAVGIDSMLLQGALRQGIGVLQSLDEIGGKKAGKEVT